MTRKSVEGSTTIGLGQGCLDRVIWELGTSSGTADFIGVYIEVKRPIEYYLRSRLRM